MFITHYRRCYKLDSGHSGQWTLRTGHWWTAAMNGRMAEWQNGRMTCLAVCSVNLSAPGARQEMPFSSGHWRTPTFTPPITLQPVSDVTHSAVTSLSIIAVYYIGQSLLVVEDIGLVVFVLCANRSCLHTDRLFCTRTSDAACAILEAIRNDRWLCDVIDSSQQQQQRHIKLELLVKSPHLFTATHQQ